MQAGGFYEITTTAQKIDPNAHHRPVSRRWCTKHLGRPDKKTTKRIEAIDDFEEAERLSERLFDVKSWQELFRA